MKGDAMRQRPSPATAISLTALVIAMSGTAYAATGGTFILGRANTATSVSSLSNKNGTALSLSSKHGKPPLTVSSSVLVPNLNASKLGGIPAHGFMTGPGRAVSASASLGGMGVTGPIAATPISALSGACDQSGHNGAYMVINLASGASLEWWNFNGVDASISSLVQVTPESTQDFMVIAQVIKGNTVVTYTASQTYDSGANVCKFTAQAVVTTQ